MVIKKMVTHGSGDYFWYIGTVGLLTSLGIMDSLYHYVRHNRFPFSNIIAQLIGTAPPLLAQYGEPQLGQNTPAEETRQPAQPESAPTTAPLSLKTAGSGGSGSLLTWPTRLCKFAPYPKSWKKSQLGGCIDGWCPLVPLFIPIVLLALVIRCPVPEMLLAEEEEEEEYVPDVNPYALAYGGATLSLVTAALAWCGRRTIFIWETLKFKHIIATKYWQDD